MSAKSGTYWFWTDWLGDQSVRRLTLAERGLWIDLLALAAVGNPAGYVCDEKGKPLTHEEIARVTNAGSPVEVAELIKGILEKGAASRDRTGRLFNRRMVRAAEIAAKKRLSGKIGGVHTKLKWQEFQALPQQMPWHLPQHVPRQGKSSLTLKESKKASSSEAAREAAPVETQQKGLSEGGRPSSTSRAELEQMFARRRNTAGIKAEKAEDDPPLSAKS